MNGSWDAYLASSADFAGVDDIIPILAKEREPGIKIVKHTPSSVIVGCYCSLFILFTVQDFFNCVYTCTYRMGSLILR